VWLQGQVLRNAFLGQLLTGSTLRCDLGAVRSIGAAAAVLSSLSCWCPHREAGIDAGGDSVEYSSADPGGGTRKGCGGDLTCGFVRTDLRLCGAGAAGARGASAEMRDGDLSSAAVRSAAPCTLACCCGGLRRRLCFVRHGFTLLPAWQLRGLTTVARTRLATAVDCCCVGCAGVKFSAGDCADLL
jgi:hypothetical protein